MPHGTGETECTPVARHPLAVRRACALLRDSTLALALVLGQHGRVFTAGPAPANPSKRDLVVKVLEQVYKKDRAMSSMKLDGERDVPAVPTPKGSPFIAPGNVRSDQWHPETLDACNQLCLASHAAIAWLTRSG